MLNFDDLVCVGTSTEDAGHEQRAGLRGTAKNVANLATSVTKSAAAVTKMSASAVTKTATSATVAASKATTVGFKATKAATNATKNATKFATKGVKKATFGLFRRKKNRSGEDGTSTMSADDDYSESEDASEMGMTPASMPIEIGKMPVLQEKRNKSFVELHYLDAVETKSTEGSASFPPATTTSLGYMTLRGGNRNLPVAVFGGPVVCVATKSQENDEGSAHFYTRKSDERGTKASEYVATGPTLPFPDLVVWDDDGVYCAVIANNRVAVYLSEPPSFVLMGSVRVALPSHADSRITSARFIHGVLYCCTVSSVHAGKFDVNLIERAITGLLLTFLTRLQTFLSSTFDSLSW